MRFYCAKRESDCSSHLSTGLSDPEVKNWEIDGLMEAMTTYQLQERIILTENEHDIIEINGFWISVIPIWKWLLYQEKDMP
jgi:predicted AAA+ superfamily ATPase